ncbi:hypothetical protein SY27_02430 [Flavobacterium sp. 316]|uniref:tetratricopeptide repeat protein n=1 Tax=Flavobacterium sp. 316 TaxID=1603293 RepID=UPI0005DFECAA|nr:tetratricopeptide repeat protein [Flavobacterium sp. 316]KIX22700.1 hypothetical protein SY27_02430 [Flavobacterium sp. 316]
MNTDLIKQKSKAQKYSEALHLLLEHTKEDIIESNLLDDLLYDYFSKEKIHSETLEIKLSELFPENFVKAVRTTQVFLDTNRLTFFKNLPLLQKFMEHLMLWENLQKEELKLWNTISKESSELFKFEVDYVLSEVVFWLENERYSDNSQQNLTKLGTVYNFFIEFYWHSAKEPVNIALEKCSQTFHKLVFEKIKSNKIIDPKIHSILTAIRHWISFNEDVLQAYCFDLEINPLIENDCLYFVQNPKHYYKWKLDGLRYNKVSFDYQLKAQEAISNLIIQNKLIIPGKTESDFEMNFDAAVKLKKIELFLHDTTIPNYIHNGKKISIDRIFHGISTYSTHKLYRYENNIEQFKSISTNWFDNYLKIIALSVKNKIEILPYLLINKETYVALVKDVTGFSEEDTSLSFDSLSYEINKKKDFDRFNINYNIWTKPFLKTGNLFFCPMLFLATNDWFFAATQMAIQHLNWNFSERKSTATEMEIYLGNTFEQKGYKVKVIEDKEANSVKGDVDIIIEDANTTLFIQLKRTYLRLLTKDAFNESVQSDKKASEQLNDAEISLKQENNIYNLKQKPVKWIVSTSFEGINTNVKGCRKINYFDLLFALENNKIKSLAELIAHLEKDRNMISLDDLENNLDVLKNFGLPLKLKEPETFKQCVYHFKKDTNYIEMLNKGISLYSKNVIKAIKILEQCAKINENDVTVYATLGNCYANLKKVASMKKAFEKALAIIPNDPYVKRNYALALIENESYYDGLIKLLELIEDYGYIEDVLFIFKNKFSTYKNRLTIEERKAIQERYNFI